ncbi:hypothetical protein [Pseudonocardia sp. WMMC193]|uniref:hypothetical protein n=1 Tax=Pseudonocardia sp. WMMC193 TaxID=2911965 RepID=UPI001F38C399|nr:hypothetical protein [Pseudonocardia sp. WMMC193]MCF7550955.1 hypothetical protein [Pseudonocardia sp. WMMC193]
MPDTVPLRDDLTIYWGRTFGPYGWILRDDLGRPLRSADGIHAVAKIRAHPDGEVLTTFVAEVTARVIEGDPEPVVLALLTLSTEQTRLPIRTGVYDVLVDAVGQHNPPGVEGRITVELPVSR